MFRKKEEKKPQSNCELSWLLDIFTVSFCYELRVYSPLNIALWDTKLRYVEALPIFCHTWSCRVLRLIPQLESRWPVMSSSCMWSLWVTGVCRCNGCTQEVKSANSSSMWDFRWGTEYLGKGDVGNAIVNTYSQTASAIFSTSNGPTGVFLLP